MAQQYKLGTGHTTIKTENGKTVIRFWNTDIVKFSNDEIILNTGGCYTATTKTRMNQASSQFDLGFSVSQKNGNWFVDYRGNKIPFEDGMSLVRI